ncbi:alpha-l-rhamnosidase a [Fusarium flagelliforme]|uniref:alpha-L-rhamnosidase n=1 Tax=Fusarium flagelliforme TaxID=2675880 RepID=A0A395MI20_9HYPO|nr:alpha-l-rhamnosidase a [Fusarium flagelliforme]
MLLFTFRDQRQAAVDRLAELVEEANFHFTPDLMSNGLLLPTLASNERADITYRLLMQDTVSSWLYQVNREAKTTWETWEEYDKKGNAVMSHNYYAFGTVVQRLQEGVAGMSPVAAGWWRIKIRPYVRGGLLYTAVSVNTPLDMVKSFWKLIEGTDQVELEVVIPVYSSAQVMLGDQRVEGVRSGLHNFVCKVNL